MAEKNNRRWLVLAVSFLSFLAFAGFSIVPFIEAFRQPPPQTAASPSPVQSASASPTVKKEDLEAQAKGYELVLQREPDNQTALRGLLEARFNLIRMGSGSVKDVIAPLEKLAQLNPNETNYSVLLAQAKQQAGDREGAAQTYRDILKVKPGDPNALDGLVTLLVQENRPEAAIGLLQDTLKTAPQANQVQPGSIDPVTVQILLGRVYADQKRYDEAIAVYDEAAKANKQDFRPVLAKAIIFKAQGKTAEAKPLFASASDLAPAQYKDQIKKLSEESTTLSPTPTPAAPAGGATPSPVPSP